MPRFSLVTENFGAYEILVYGVLNKHINTLTMATAPVNKHPLFNNLTHDRHTPAFFFLPRIFHRIDEF